MKRNDSSESLFLESEDLIDKKLHFPKYNTDEGFLMDLDSVQ